MKDYRVLVDKHWAKLVSDLVHKTNWLREIWPQRHNSDDGIDRELLTRKAIHDLELANFAVVVCEIDWDYWNLKHPAVYARELTGKYNMS